MRGFSLIETLVAMALALLVIGAVVPLVTTNSVVAWTAPEMIDEQQRARAGAEGMLRDLSMAGAGLSAGPAAGSLIRSFAPVIPRRLGLVGADAFNVARSDAITIVYVPQTVAQSVLLQPIASSLDPLHVDTSVGCAHGTQACGLQPGGTALVFDGAGNFDLFGILSLQSNAATIEHRQQGIPLFAYAAGAGAAEAESHTYYFDRTALQLRHYDGARSDVPVVDNVVSAAFEYFGDPDPPAWPRPPLGTANCLYDVAGGRFGMATMSSGSATVSLPLGLFADGPWCGAGSNRYDADLLRIRIIRVTLRVQTGAGRGGSVVRSIPDYSLRLDVSPRNMNAGKN